MNTPVAVVFYDGGCALCRREIDHYPRRRGAERLLWIDITQEGAMLRAYGLKTEHAMARFHVLDASGNWHTGTWGFVELWSHLPAYRWLARALRALRLVGILDRVYTRFARWRLQQRCLDNSCGTAPESAKSGATAARQRKREVRQ